MTPAFNGMLFDRSLICASCGAAVAAVIVAALALVVGRFVRRRPAPLRYGLLLAALVVLGIVPAVAAASRLGGWGAVRISPVAVDRPLAPQPFLVTPAVPRPMPMPAIADGEEALRPDRIAEPTVMPMRVPTLREAASGLLWAWLGGLLFFVGMVIRDLVRLRLLRQTLVPCPSPAAVGLLNDAARSVGLTQPPRLFESAAVPVPVVIGPVKPVVVLPAGMANTLDHEKLTAVLLHEAAHVVHGDLWVGLLQHAVAAIFWWCPPVHRLNRRLAEVREEICDDYVVLAQGDGFQLAEVLVEMAAGLRGSRQRLTIGTLGAIDEKPALEGRVERLIDLTRKAAPMTRMNRLAVVAAGAFGLVALAIVLATTIHAADEPPAAEPKASAPPLGSTEAKEPSAVGVVDVKVRVVDPDGHPVAKAKVTPWGLRSSLGNVHGLWLKGDKYCDLSPTATWTDATGITTVAYPYYRDNDEQIRTIAVSLQVDHTEFAVLDDVHVEVPRTTQEPYEIKLSLGVPVEVRPVLNGTVASHDNLFTLFSDGRSRQPGFTPRISAEGNLGFSAMRPGANSVLLVKLDGDRATHFSRTTDFNLAVGEPKQLDVELQPGVCIRGTLSENVPRPVRNGRVSAWSLNPTNTVMNRVIWRTWAPIQPDGTFIIDSWPADEPIQLIALCEGFIAANGSAPQEVKNPPDPGSDRIGRSQVFRPSKDSRVELAMAPLVRCDVTAVGKDNKPLAGVTVEACPNVWWWNMGSQIYCHPLVRGERLLRTRQVVDTFDNVFPPPFVASTDANGRATLELPSGSELLGVKSDAYELPIVQGRREVVVRLTRGETTNILLRLQPRGTEKLGDQESHRRSDAKGSLGSREAKEPPAEAAATSRGPEQAIVQTLTQPENGPGQTPGFPFAGTVVRVAEDKYGVWSVTVSDDTRVSIPRAIVDSLRKSGRQCDTVSVAPLQRLEPTQTPHFKSPGLAVALERGGNRAYIASSEGLDFDVVSIVSDAIRAVGYDEVVLVSKPKASPAALSVTEALAGKWVNIDEKTSSIKRLEIQKEADGWVIHAWGSCQPTDCDWGTVPLHMAVDAADAADAAGIPLDVGQMKYGVAQWDQLDNAIRTFMTLRIEDGELIAESVDVFQNTLGQANIRCKDSFKREIQFLPDATLTRPLDNSGSDTAR